MDGSGLGSCNLSPQDPAQCSPQDHRVKSLDILEKTYTSLSGIGLPLVDFYMRRPFETTMNGRSERDLPLWLQTPLLYSQHISTLIDCDAYLKLENLQPSQSFKYRGMSLVAKEAKEKSEDAHLIIASGGNAGYAAACAAKTVGIPCTVFLPAGLSPRFLDNLRKEGAEVVVAGGDYFKAFTKAQEAAAKDEKGVMVHAYDDATLWRGHASLIQEIAADLDAKPDAIFCSVGGAGLLSGAMVGCKMIGWDDVPIIALETIGADCFYHSMQASRRRDHTLPPGVTVFHDDEHDVYVARLPAITSAASSLGAPSPAPGAVKMALQREGGVRCVCVPDGLSMQAGLAFAEDHKFIVELACSTTLVPAYQQALFERLLPSKQTKRTVVFIVCGGSKISLAEMSMHGKIVDSHTGVWKVWIDGQLLEVEK